MHYVGDYVYDSDRLIFYDKDIPQPVVEKIKDSIEITDEYNRLKYGYDNLNKNQMSAKRKPINLIGVCLSYNCQLRCNYCSYSSTDGNLKELKTKDILSFVIEAIKIRKVYQMANHVVYVNPLRFFFTGGGEPTYNWKLFEKTVLSIKKICKQYSIPCYMELTTNGILNDFQRRFIIEHFDKVMLSYDGISEIQNRNRKCANGKESNLIAVESIKTFMESKLFLTVRTTIWRDDFGLMRDMCDNMVHNFSTVDEWSIMPIIPSGRALINSKPNQYDTTQKNFFSYYIDLIEYAKSKNYNIYISTAIFNNTIVEYCCGATFNDCFWLMPDSSIINCIEAERFRTEVGKIENSNVILYEQYIDPYLDIVKETFTDCRECLAYRFCKGGCPLKTIRDKQYGTKYRKYECQMIIQYWEYVFKKILAGEQCFGWTAVPIKKEVFGDYKVFHLKSIKEERGNAN